MRWLERLLRLGITGNEAVVTGRRNPVGYQQITSLGSAVGITAPTQNVGPPGAQMTVQVPCGFAVIQNSGTAAVRWRDDGVAPTAAVGMLLNPGAELDYAGDITKIQFIQVAATGQLEVALYQ